MRRMVLTTTATVAGVVALLSMKPHQAAQGVAAGSGGGSGSGSGSASNPGSGSGSGSAKSGTVTGDAIQTRFGPVQVKVTLSAGKITKVDVVQVPSENPRDQEIASYSVPQLKQETLTAQSAKIDTVSGATFTSEGYIQSLQSALDKWGG